MTPRVAFRFIALAAVLASLFVLTFVVLERTRAALPAGVPTSDAPQARLDVPITGVSLQLDSAGVGSQVVRGTQFTYRLQPFPPRAGVESTLSFVALNRNSGRTQPLTPTLEVGPLDNVAGGPFPVERFPDNAYLARGIFFPGAGAWRMRVSTQLFPDEPYATIIVVEAR
jgi:hypothetical protein